MKYLLGSLLILSLCSCGSDASNSISTGLDVFGIATNAFNSVATGINSSNSKMTTTCDGNGDPTSSAPGGANYAGDKVFCQFSVNSKSPDTIQGSYFLASAVLCAIEKTYSFQYLTSTTTADAISFAESDSCFGTGGFDANGDSDINDTITLSLREAALVSQDYDYHIELQLGATTYNGSNPNTLEMYLLDSNGVLGAKIYQEGQSITEVIIDIPNTEVLFENRDFDNSRHIRVKIDGNFSPTTGTFSSVGLAQALIAESSTVVMFGFDGSAEWVDHYISGSQDADYDQCSTGLCTGLTTAFSSSFYTFPGATTSYHNATKLSIPTFDMTF